MKTDIKRLQREAQADFEKLKACKTPKEATAFLSGRKMFVKDNGPFHDELVDFIEVVGEGSNKANWRMKVKTSLGNHLLLKGSEVMITFKSIKV